jgi:excisionase family DNA binding protein
MMVKDGQPPETAMMMIERKTISIMKACELVGVSRRTIYNWIASGKIEYVRTAGGSVRIFVDTLWREPSRAADFHPKEAS